MILFNFLRDLSKRLSILMIKNEQILANFLSQNTNLSLQTYNLIIFKSLSHCQLKAYFYNTCQKEIPILKQLKINMRFIFSFDHFYFRFLQLLTQLQVKAQRIQNYRSFSFLIDQHQYLVTKIKIQSPLTQNMLKLLLVIVKLLFLLSVFFCCLKIGLYKHARQKMLYIDSPDVKQFSKNSTSPAQASEILKRLEDLTAVPLLGRLYEQEMLVELLRLHRYQQSLNLVNGILYSPFKQKSFKLWYLKAEIQISLSLLEEGEQSLTKASMYAKKQYQNSLVDSLGDALSKNKEIQDYSQAVLKSQGIQLSKDEVEEYLKEKKTWERQNL